MENEFRYLTKAGAGLMEFDYLPSDKVFQTSIRAKVISTAGCTTGSTPGIGSGVALQHRLRKVSDPYYFNDFDSKYGSSTDGYATQKFSVGYAVRTLTRRCRPNSSVFDTQSRSTYGAEPQLDVNWYQNDVGPF